MRVVDTRRVGADRAFLFDDGFVSFYGPDVLPGTDVPTYRFRYRGSLGKEEKRVMMHAARDYCREHGLEAVICH